VPIKDVQVALGHADVRTTLNIYAKAVPGWESSAVARVDAYLEEDPSAKVLRKSDAEEAG
jgi:integrase